MGGNLWQDGVCVLIAVQEAGGGGGGGFYVLGSL